MADPGCLSRIPDPDFYPSRISDPGSRISDLGSRIPDPKTATKERGGKKFVVIIFYVATNFTKLQIILFLKFWRKELYNFLPKKLSISSQKYGFGIRDPRSGIRKKPNPDPGSWIQVSKRHRIPDPDPQHCPRLSVLEVPNNLMPHNNFDLLLQINIRVKLIMSSYFTVDTVLSFNSPVKRYIIRYIITSFVLCTNYGTAVRIRI